MAGCRIMSQLNQNHSLVEHWLEQWQADQILARQRHATLEKMLEHSGMHAQALLILYHIHVATPPGITQIELARCMMLSPGMICSWVDKLTVAGWLQVSRSLEDRRRAFCALTALGLERYSQILEQLQPLVAHRPEQELKVEGRHAA
jgi:DNA-binding MarR family transcriptional regulator